MKQLEQQQLEQQMEFLAVEGTTKMNSIPPKKKVKKVVKKPLTDQQKLDLMVYGAEQWNKSPHKHKFKERNRNKEIDKKEFCTFKKT